MYHVCFSALRGCVNVRAERRAKVPFGQYLTILNGLMGSVVDIKLWLGRGTKRSGLLDLIIFAIQLLNYIREKFRSIPMWVVQTLIRGINQGGEG